MARERYSVSPAIIQALRFHVRSAEDFGRVPPAPASFPCAWSVGRLGLKLDLVHPGQDRTGKILPWH